MMRLRKQSPRQNRPDQLPRSLQLLFTQPVIKPRKHFLLLELRMMISQKQIVTKVREIPFMSRPRGITATSSYMSTALQEKLLILAFIGYDVVGAASGAPSRAPGSPKESRKGDDSEEEDWE